MKELDAARRRLFEADFDLMPVADENHLEVRITFQSRQRTGHDRSGGVVPAHGVQRNPHGLLLLRDNHLSPLVLTTVGADAMREHGLIALAAILDLNRLNMLMAAS